MTTLLKLLQTSDNAFLNKLRRLLPIIPSAAAASQEEVNAETAADKYISPATLGTWYDQLGASLTSADSTNYYLFEDFVNSALMINISSSPAGTGAALSTIISEANRPGIGQHSTGTTATGRSCLFFSNSQSYLFGGASWLFETSNRVNTLSTLAERFAYITGFGDVTNAIVQVDGAFFLYDEGGVSTGSTASANWQCVTTSNSSRTYTTTTIPVVATQWYKLKIEVNAAGTAVVFSIDGTVVATHTTTIPTGAGRQTSFVNMMLKSIGITARTIDVDYVKINASGLSR